MWSTDKKNWTEAEDFCRKEGGHLASVHSNATFAFVLEGMNRTGLEMAWLGGNDIEEEGTWKWVDCSPWNVTFTSPFWANGEPNNAGGAEHCLHHVFNYPPFFSYLCHKWNDEGCRREQGFFVQQKHLLRWEIFYKKVTTLLQESANTQCQSPRCPRCPRCPQWPR